MPNLHQAMDDLRCPDCFGTPLTVFDQTELSCTKCQMTFACDPQNGTAALFARNWYSEIKGDIQAWWGDLYRQCYAGYEDNLKKDTFERDLDALEGMFVQRRHLAAVEMPLADLSGLKVLEIGPGSGAHSALFLKKGADVTALDITPERAYATARKMRILDSAQGRAYNGDAENLPFKDQTFDIVYSNGVLHHSEDTDKCIAEVLRVLKPGGKAVLMLYARHSAVFWCNIVPRGIFGGDIFRFPEAHWIGRVTEGKPTEGTKNPITRVYSAEAIRMLMQDFEIEALRKSSFQFDNFYVPRLTQFRAWLLGKIGRTPHPGGRLVYGMAYQVETNLELMLGNYLGFAWNIVAVKPDTDQNGGLK